MIDPAVDFLDFIVIGAQKSGTTALFEFLRRHKEVFIPAGKEVPFLINKQYSLGPDAWYESYFRDARESQKMGTVTPHYLGHPDAPERIAQHFPSASLFAILREPWARMESQYLMARRGGQESRSYGEALAGELRKSSDSSYLSWSLYGQHLDRFQTAQGNAVNLVLSRDLLQNPLVAVNNVLERLNIEEMFEHLDAEVHNVAGGNRLAQRTIAISRQVPVLKWVWQAMPPDRRATLSFALHTKTPRWRAHPEKDEQVGLVDPAIVREIDALFLADSKRLAGDLTLPGDWLDLGRP